MNISRTVFRIYVKFWPTIGINKRKNFEKKFLPKNDYVSIFSPFSVFGYKMLTSSFFSIFFSLKSSFCQYLSLVKISRYKIPLLRYLNFEFYDVMLRNVYDVTKQVFLAIIPCSLNLNFSNRYHVNLHQNALLKSYIWHS